MEDFFSFFWLFITQWWLLMGVPAAIASIISWWCPQKAERFTRIFSLRRPFGLIFFIIGIFLSGFFAWKEEHIKIEQFRKERDDALRLATSATPTGQQQRISELERELGAFKGAEAARNAREWPEITGEQGKRIAEILARHKSEKPNILISCVEENLYCTRWRSIFSDTGWNVSTPFGSLSKMVIGINIMAEKETPLLEDIVGALQTANLPVFKVIPSDQEGREQIKDRFILIIGLKTEIIEEWKNEKTHP